MPHRPTVLIAAIAVIAILIVAAPARAGGRDGRPNVVYILADDLGYHELGCYGQEKIHTPNIDRLAAEGMRFTRHYSGSPVCASSRCVLLTGKHTGHCVVRGNREMGGWGPEEPEGQLPLPDAEVTIAEILKDRGYATGAFGKWGLGGPGSVGHPNRQGFDHFYGYLCQRVAHNYYPTHLWRNHDVDVLHGNRHFKAHQKIAEPLPTEADYDERFRGGDYAPDEMIKEAVGFIREHRDEPFFLYYASPLPHLALQAPAEIVDQYPREWDPEPYLGDRGYLPNARPRATYAAMITCLDRNVGMILDALDAEGLAGDTLVMFSSDNGTTFTGGCDREFFASLGELRGHKCTVYEGGLRVPMIARWPGTIAAGSVTDHASAFQDVLPTIAEVAGADAPEGIDGISFAPALRGSWVQPMHLYLYWEYPESDRQQAVLMGDYKAVRRNLKGGDLTIRLYDLKTDPGETTDVAADHPEYVESMRRVMDSAREPSAEFPIPALDAVADQEDAAGAS